MSIEIGFRQVQDPYEPDQQLTVAVNVNTDLVQFWYHKELINYAQFLAGREFLALAEKAEGSRYLVCDPAREPVDCSAVPQVHDYRLEAARELDSVARYLGRRDYHLARRYLAGVTEAYQAPTSQRERDYQYRRLKDVLEDLARYWKFA